MPTTRTTSDKHEDAARRAFDAEYALLEEMREAMEAVKAAGDDCAALGKVHEGLVGYDLHADDPRLSASELRFYVHDYIREALNDADIDPTLVGLED